jgi:hypothetical protein
MGTSTIAWRARWLTTPNVDRLASMHGHLERFFAGRRRSGVGYVEAIAKRRVAALRIADARAMSRVAGLNRSVRTAA